MIRRPPVSLVASGIALAVASVVFAYAAARAVTIAPAPELASSAPPRAAPPGTAHEVGAAAIQAAVSADPFRSDRRRPPRRYALPGSPRPVRVAAPPALSLAGTVVYPDGGGVAIVRVAGRGGTQLVRVGESIQGLTLRAVAREEAVFARAGGGRVVLRVPKAGS
jgi:hypothetical protein